MPTPSRDLFAGILPFVAVAEARSFRGAARQLGVTPSALSKSLSKLETEVGARLLHRTSRSVTLTTDGEAFLTRCREAVDGVRAAREAASTSQRIPRGELTISLPLPLARHVIMPALPRWLGLHPGLSVRVVVTDRAVDLVKENVDVVLRVGAAPDSRLVARRLRGTRWMTVASPAYLARHGVPRAPRDLDGHNCLRFVTPSGRPREWVFRGVGSGRAGEVPAPFATGNLLADHGDGLVQAAVAGGGIVQALDFMVQVAVASGDLVEVLAAQAAPGPEIVALTAPGRSLAVRVRAFLAFVVETCGDPPARRELTR